VGSLVLFALPTLFGITLILFGSPLVETVWPLLTESAVARIPAKLGPPVLVVKKLLIEGGMILICGGLSVLLLCLAAKIVKQRWMSVTVGSIIIANAIVSFLSNSMILPLALWQGEQSDNLVRFTLKLNSPANPKIDEMVIMGSSQARAAIDESILGNVLHDCKVSELHFPGTQPIDLVCLSDNVLRKRKPEFVLLYISELDLLGPITGNSIRYFVSPRNIFSLAELGQDYRKFKAMLVKGAAISMVPIYRWREPIQDRLFGVRLGSMEQQQWNRSSDSSSLLSNAKKFGSRFSLDHSELQISSMNYFRIPVCR